jgi:signal transduction histidine kinase
MIFGGLMFNKPWRLILILLSNALIAFVSGLIVKGMIIKDLDQHLSAERMDLVRVVTSDIGTIVQVGSFLTAGLVLVSVFLLSRTTDDRSRTRVKVSDSTSREHAQEGSPVPHKKDRSSSGAIQADMRQDELAVRVAMVEEGSPEAMQEEPLDADDEDLQQIPGESDRITTIVKGLDALARAEALRTSMQKQPLALAAHLNKIIENTRASVRNKDITFTLECGPEIMLSIDPECLDGIVFNLLDNAIKAVKKEGTVAVRAVVENDQVVFEVRDTGTGIRKKNVPHLFERFYRGSGNGIGLGLTIVQALVDACRGTVAVRTAWGKGSSFIIRIPLS